MSQPEEREQDQQEPQEGPESATRRRGDRPGDWHARKARLLTRRAPSIARSIARAIVLKDQELFLVVDHEGAIPIGSQHGFGLYYRDCRFLNGYEIGIAGTSPAPLASAALSSHRAVFELTNPDVQLPDGRTLHRHELGVRWERGVDGEAVAVRDEISIRNFSREVVEIDLSVELRADFEDIYVVRGIAPPPDGACHDPAWHGDELRLSRRGEDGVLRATSIRFSRSPDATGGSIARFRIRIDPGGRECLTAVIALSDTRDGARSARPDVDIEAAQRRVERHEQRFRTERAGVETDSLLVNRILDRAFDDLILLRTPRDGDSYFAAGIPWFATLFGRDSLITAIEMLPYHTGIAEQTLRLLARYQGTDVDHWRDEQPGKILHELRAGELANLGAIPHTPYYGTADATALFLILLARHAEWTGRLDLFRELRPHVDAALAWIADYGEREGIEGYVAYRSEPGDVLVNQGWKDSGDAIIDESGEIVDPPIALVEVQAYTYLAKTSIAALCDHAGEADLGARLRREAAALRERWNRDFWLPDRGHYALALTRGGRPAAVLSSNPGHALWAGITDIDKARATAASFMTDEMFSGWGVRTLASNERGYNPISYHRGTVWPHDNALLVAGLRRHALDEEAGRIFDGILSAAMNFPLYRLPEVWSGFPRAEYGVPVRYPVACHPQAWASGAIPYMLSAMIGLEPRGFERRLVVARPVMPPFMNRVEMHGIAVAGGRVDLEISRARDGAAEVRVLRVEGGIDVSVVR